jgi:hypothetical protein
MLTTYKPGVTKTLGIAQNPKKKSEENVPKPADHAGG